MLKKMTLPILLYLIGFYLFNPHLLAVFSSAFYCDTGDGLQNVWNLWWINKSVAELHRSPWFTQYLHFPSGVTLVGQTLNPLNGFIGVALLNYLTLIQTNNVIILIGFVVGGWSAFLLCLDIVDSYWPALAGGAIFTFSNYHFMHAEGHMQLVSLEFIPLFALYWRRLCLKPSVKNATCAAIFLILTLLCDYYYFLYSVFLGFLYFAYEAGRSRDVVAHIKKNIYPSIVFIALAAMGCLPLVFSLLIQNHMDPFTGAHSSLENSMDLFGPFIPSSHWRFGSLTQKIWGQWIPNPNESGVFLGFSVMALTAWTWRQRRLLKKRIPDLWFWFGAASLFGILSLGPKVHILGREIRFLPMPYRLLELTLPPLRLSGMPIRMMVMTELALAVIAAVGIADLIEKRRKAYPVSLVVLFLVWIVEMLPRPIPATTPTIPGYIHALSKESPGAVLDLVSAEGWSLYYQTIHQKPMGFGYVSRLPQSIDKMDKDIQALIRGNAWEPLACSYRFNYILTRKTIESACVHQLSYDPSLQVHLYALDCSR